MASLGRLEFSVIDSSGNAVSGVSVTVCKQGAQVRGAQASVTVVTVDSPGALVAGDQVRYGTASSPTRSVTAVSATTVSIGGPGDTFSDDDRMRCITLPTIYEDDAGNVATSNPLTTDTNGYAACYVVGAKYDVLISGGGQTTRLLQDVVCGGGESVRSNIYSGTAWTLDTLRTLAATDKLLDLQTAGASKFSVAGDGEIVAGAAGATHALTGNTTVTGNVTASGTLTAQTSGSSITGTLTIAGITGNIQQAGGLVANAFAASTTFSGGVTISGAGKTLSVTTDTGIKLIGTRVTQKAWTNFADLDTTPDVSAGNYFTLAYSLPTSITNFDGGPNGTDLQEITLRFTNATVVTLVHDVTKIRLVGGANFTSTTADTITLVSDTSNPTIWYEKARSVNG